MWLDIRRLLSKVGLTKRARIITIARTTASGITTVFDSPLAKASGFSAGFVDVEVAVDAAESLVDVPSTWRRRGGGRGRGRADTRPYPPRSKGSTTIIISQSVTALYPAKRRNEVTRRECDWRSLQDDGNDGTDGESDS